MDRETQTDPRRCGDAVEPSLGTPVPWHAFAVAFGATSIVVGLLWDISWHITIGRDTFWTPAHMAIYLGGALPGMVCGWLVLRTTLRGSPAERAASVRVWGMRGPLGAWVTIWGAGAMLTSAPFDDWWHGAYGLDVTILSPPHSVLGAGMFSVVGGALFVVLGVQNRAGAGSRAGALLFCWATGVFLTMAATLAMEHTLPNQQHALTFHLIAAGVFPFILVAPAAAARLSWGGTAVALTYSLIQCAMVWILPLFSARPMLAPIYNPVDHMVPPAFPLLLIVPAVGIDLVLARAGRAGGTWRDVGLSFVLGAVFLATFLPAQWRFAEFLLSPAAENAVFAGNRYWSYMDWLGDWTRRFFDLDRDPVRAGGVAIAYALATASSALGLFGGRWMARVMR